MRAIRFLALVVALSLASLAYAQKDAAPAPDAKIASMAWLKGYWTGEGYGGQVETLMGPPKAGVMLGYFRHFRPDGKPGFYEMCAIEEHEGSLRFVIKHFHPNWVGWEEKDYAMQARLTRLAKDEAVFGNMTIRRTGKDTAEMELLVAGKEGGSRKEVLRLKRQAL
jgi:hypothetical protein